MRNHLREYLREEIDKNQFRQFISADPSLEGRFGRTTYLQLKYGDLNTVLKTYQKINNCSVCSELQSDGLRGSTGRFILSRLEGLVASGELVIVQKPSWYKPHLAMKNHLSEQCFLHCSTCEGILDYCYPEHICNGCCELIG